VTTRPASATVAARAADTVRALARRPRPAGGEAEAEARALCAERLRAAGFDVREEPFAYSGWVGRWGTPLGGLIAAAIVLPATSLGRGGAPGTALGLLTLGAVVLGVVARWLAVRGVLSFPLDRRMGTNLIATRGGSTPTTWLMAHVDSKSQPVPILVRALGITLLIVAWVSAAVFAAVQLAAASPGAWTVLWNVIAVVAAVGALPVIATTVGARSPGALDNATGVATVLAAAELSSGPLGVCLTSAEELGLAGARAWVRDRGSAPPGVVAVNCDGVDDDGTFTCMHSGARPAALIDAIAAAAARSRVSLRAHRLLPGVLTDGVALADAGWPVVTLSKGSARTLARIHTPRDRAESMSGEGMAEVSGVMVALLESRA
jgi:hypothetical protein